LLERLQKIIYLVSLFLSSFVLFSFIAFKLGLFKQQKLPDPLEFVRIYSQLGFKVSGRALINLPPSIYGSIDFANAKEKINKTLKIIRQS